MFLFQGSDDGQLGPSRTQALAGPQVPLSSDAASPQVGVRGSSGTPSDRDLRSQLGRRGGTSSASGHKEGVLSLVVEGHQAPLKVPLSPQLIPAIPPKIPQGELENSHYLRPDPQGAARRSHLLSPP